MGQVLKVGTRGSQLALVQTQDTLQRLAGLFTQFAFESVVMETPGDRDLSTDLRDSPADFFTRDLDRALLDGTLDLALHSAKDLPEVLAEGLDWVWLPWQAEPRDVWVLAPGRRLEDLAPTAVVGISSQRRATYCRRRLPQAEIATIRGAIPARLEQLDAGKFDALIMAGAALERLALTDRISEWIPLEELPVPAGQGRLALSFRRGDPRVVRLRDYFVKAVRFVGAGVGSADYCTWGGIKDLQGAEVCLYDVLMDAGLLQFLPSTAERIFVGKRCGEHSLPQTAITELLLRYVRQGKRVVRLKGGDPGLFGRLAEETDALEHHALAYRVRAGVSALTVATSGTGLLLTRRGVSRGFTALTPRAADGTVPGIAAEARLQMPLVLFMSVQLAAPMAQQLLSEGWAASTAVNIVYNAGADDEARWRTTLGQLHDGSAVPPENPAPGLILIGSTLGQGFERELGALRGIKVLLTCSEALIERAARRVIDFGGQPILRPLIRLEPCAAALEEVAQVGNYDWVVLTSPSAAEIFIEQARCVGVDWRRMPQIMACGPGSQGVFVKHGLTPDLVPPLEYSAEGLIKQFAEVDLSGQRVLRLRSAKAGPRLAQALEQCGAIVNDVQLYENQVLEHAHIPEFDAVFFASASAVDAFLAQTDGNLLRSKVIVTIGKPTMERLLDGGYTPDVVADNATVNGAIEALARTWINYS